MTFFSRSGREEREDMPIQAQPLIQGQAEAGHCERPPAQTILAPDVESVARILAHSRLRMRRGVVVWLWKLLTPLLVVAPCLSLVHADWAWSAGSTFLLLTALRIHGLTTSLEQAQAALQASSVMDKRWVGALVEALEWPHKRVQSIARLLLNRLLPQFQEEDVRWLQADQRACLYRQLTPLQAARNPEFVTTILEALARIGDAQAPPSMQRLAEMLAFTAAMRRVRAAARASLALLEERLEAGDIGLPTAPETAASAAGQQSAESSDAEAAQGAAEVSPEVARASAHVEAQLRALEQEIRRQQPGMRIGFLIAAWGVIVPCTATKTGLALAQHDWLQGLIWAGLLIAATQLYRLTLTRKHTEIARRLARLDDVQGIGRLAAALEWPDGEIRAIVMHALTRLLPRLKASDAALLSAEQRACLYRMLKMSYARAQADFILAVLKALEQVGDAAAVPYVARLANSVPHSARQRRVREAAIECLPYLQDRAQQSQMRQTLLRASNVSGTAPEVLLRPAAGKAGDVPEQMLRASAAEE
ncbi:MAG TPA: hypothetical protein VFB38_04475 [Chthonomonadaceae bacterium]|nr:hypothetical protein [Chthonomonadaceae bacterium]